MPTKLGAHVWRTPYAQFEIERMKLMAQYGLKCVIGNFATGTPPLELWPAFIPALQAARQYEALLGLHEYSCPWMWWMTGKHQLDPNEDQGGRGLGDAALSQGLPPLSDPERAQRCAVGAHRMRH